MSHPPDFPEEPPSSRAFGASLPRPLGSRRQPASRQAVVWLCLRVHRREPGLLSARQLVPATPQSAACCLQTQLLRVSAALSRIPGGTSASLPGPGPPCQGGSHQLAPGAAGIRGPKERRPAGPGRVDWPAASHRLFVRWSLRARLGRQVVRASRAGPWPAPVSAGGSLAGGPRLQEPGGAARESEPGLAARGPLV